MKINIGYFTSTGNTFWLAERAKNMMERKHDVELFEAVSSGSKFLYECDLAGIVFPVWDTLMPEPLINAVENFDKDDNRKVPDKLFLLGNCAKFFGDAGIYWKKRIENSINIDVFYFNYFVMPRNVHIPGYNWWDLRPLQERKKLMRDAESKLEDVCKQLINFERRKNIELTMYERIGSLAKRRFNFIKKFWARMLKVEEERCIDCHLCYKMCPTNAIDIPEYEKISIKFQASKCILCLRCFNLCPEDAVLVGNKSKDVEEYKRYKGPRENFQPTFYR